MAFNGSGVFQRLYNWVQDRQNGIKINSTRMDAEMDGFAQGLSNCITRDGQTIIQADIPFNGRKITGLGVATAGDHALSREAADGRYIRLAGATPDAFVKRSHRTLYYGGTSYPAGPAISMNTVPTKSTGARQYDISHVRGSANSYLMVTVKLKGFAAPSTGAYFVASLFRNEETEAVETVARRAVGNPAYEPEFFELTYMATDAAPAGTEEKFEVYFGTSTGADFYTRAYNPPSRLLGVGAQLVIIVDEYSHPAEP